MWKKERHRTGEPALGRKLRSGPGTDALQVPTVQGQAEAERIPTRDLFVCVMVAEKSSTAGSESCGLTQWSNT